MISWFIDGSTADCDILLLVNFFIVGFGDILFLFLGRLRGSRPLFARSDCIGPVPALVPDWV